MERIQKLIPLIKPFYQSGDPAHDWIHVGRVMKTCQLLSQGEEVHLSCLLAGAMCHDLVNLPKDHPERKKASQLAADQAEPFLKESGFDSTEIQMIKSIILEHSFSKGLKPSTIEAAILQDADRLDALGAIGVLRCAAVNSQMKTNFYEPLDPFAKERELDDKSFMVDHYYVKLLKLPEMMNTQNGRAEAQRRADFMRSFLHELGTEIQGNILHV